MGLAFCIEAANIQPGINGDAVTRHARVVQQANDHWNSRIQLGIANIAGAAGIGNQCIGGGYVLNVLAIDRSTEKNFCQFCNIGQGKTGWCVVNNVLRQHIFCRDIATHPTGSQCQLCSKFAKQQRIGIVCSSGVVGI